MNISNVWNSIVEWFSDRSDRNRLIHDLTEMHGKLLFTGVCRSY